MMNPEEKVIASYIYNRAQALILGTKNGMAKRTLMASFLVQRCTKPMTAFKLKENDELVSVVIQKENVLFITQNGYYLNYKSEELPILGSKASGVKGIALKETQVINMVSYNSNEEYLTIFTDNKTAKRVKLEELEQHSRAKKGSLLMKKTKTVSYKVLTAFPSTSRDLVLTKADSEINVFKNSDIAIMDLASTGSNISKYKLDTAALVAQKEKIISEEPKKEEEPKTSEPRALSMQDFIDDFKL